MMAAPYCAHLSRQQGSRLILFSHPADFTPVCITEFVAVAQIAEELRRRNGELLGLSIDSVYSHIAWVRSIEEHFKVKVIVPPPRTTEAAEERMKAGFDCVDWFFCTKDLPSPDHSPKTRE